MSCGTAARLGLARSPRSPQQSSQFFVKCFRNKRRRHQLQPQHNSRRRTAAAAAAATCGVGGGGGGGIGDGVVVYRRWLTKSAPDTTSRSSREPGRIVENAGALAHKHLPLRFRVRVILPQLPFVPPHQGWVVSTAANHSEQRIVSAVCCRVGCALVPSDCCAVVPEEPRC